MGMPVAIIAKGVDCHNRAEESAIIFEIYPQNFGDAENVLTVGNWIEDSMAEIFAEKHHLFGVAGRAEPAAPAEKARRYS